MSNVEVHRTHCCREHGCKYDNDDCPVERGEIKQAYPCEWCSMAVEEMERLLHEIFDFETNGALTRAFYDGLTKRGLKLVEIDE